MSHSDSLAAVEGLIVSACLCSACITAKSGLPARDVDIALRILLRAKSAELAEACDSCRNEMRAFRAQPRT